MVAVEGDGSINCWNMVVLFGVGGKSSVLQHDIVSMEDSYGVGKV